MRALVHYVPRLLLAAVLLKAFDSAAALRADDAPPQAVPHEILAAMLKGYQDQLAVKEKQIKSLEELVTASEALEAELKRVLDAASAVVPPVAAAVSAATTRHNQQIPKSQLARDQLKTAKEEKTKLQERITNFTDAIKAIEPKKPEPNEPEPKKPEPKPGPHAQSSDSDEQNSVARPVAASVMRRLNEWKTLELRRDIVFTALAKEDEKFQGLMQQVSDGEQKLIVLATKLYATKGAKGTEWDKLLREYTTRESALNEIRKLRQDSDRRVKSLRDELEELDKKIPEAKKNLVAGIPVDAGAEEAPKPETETKPIATNDRYKATAKYSDSDVERGHFAAHQVPVVRPLPLAVGYRGPWNDPAGIFQDGMPRLDSPTANPTAENQVHRVVFTQPARFPRWEYDLAQTPLEAEGLVVYEDMELVFTRAGQYEVRFSTSAPEVPVTLRLQFQLNKYENGYCASTNRLFTLPPIVIRPAAVSDAASHARELVDERTRHAPRVVRHCGYSAALAKAFAHMPHDEIESVTCENQHEATGYRLERVGTARFGYGLLLDGAVAGN